ncbi:MAG: hypothetical protein R3F31_11515 [Verrucomicrobiales bacterium]
MSRVTPTRFEGSSESGSVQMERSRALGGIAEVGESESVVFRIGEALVASAGAGEPSV